MQSSLAQGRITWGYLRSGRYIVHTRPLKPDNSVSPPEATPPKPLVVKAIEWKVVRLTEDLQAKITEIARLIAEVIEHATTTNLPPDQRALSDIERAQLIAILRTALKVLESPMMEKGLLKKAAAMVKRAAGKAAEKQVELALNTSATMLGLALFDFIKHL